MVLNLQHPLVTKIAVRDVVAVLALPGVVLARHDLWLLAPLAVVLFLAGRTAPARGCFLILAAALALGMPWIVAPLLAGAAWFLWPRADQGLRVRVRALASETSTGALGAACALGALAGAAAWVPTSWQVSAHPVVFDLTRPTPVALAASIVVLAAANAIGEELLWRGALMSQTRRWPAPLVYAGQAVSFGAAHWFGLPGGLLGACLTALFSLANTYVHRRWGLVAAILAHWVADVLIFAACLPHVLFVGWSTG